MPCPVRERRSRWWVGVVGRTKASSRQSETLDCWHGAEHISNAWGQHRGCWIARHVKIRTDWLPVFLIKKWLPV